MQPAFNIHRMSKPSGSALPLHSHDEAQLTYAASGMIQLHTNEGVWLVPPSLRHGFRQVFPIAWIS